MDQSTQTAGTDVDKSSPQTKALLVQDPSTQTENLCLSHHAKYIYTVFCDGLPAVIRAKRNLGIKINKTYSVLMIINVVILADILFGFSLNCTLHGECTAIWHKNVSFS